MKPDFLTNKLTANGVLSFVTGLLIFLIAIGSFALSYSNLHETALAYGVPTRLAWIWPLLIDFALIVFSLAVVQSNLNNEPAYRRWAMVALYTVATVAFNIYHAPSNLAAQVVAVVAPVTLFLSFETLMAMLKNGVIKRNLVASINQLKQEFAQKTRELAEFEATRRAEIEASARVRQAELEARLQELEAKAQEDTRIWNDEVTRLGKKAEEKRLELTEIDSRSSQQVSQLQEQIETMERTIQSYQQDIEAKQKELKSLDNSSQVKLYLPVNLSPEQRQELVNRMSQDGLTQGQMAEILGVSVGTIKNIKKAAEVATNGRVK